MNDWVFFTRRKLVLSSVAISSPIVLTQPAPNSQSPGSIHDRSTHTRIHNRMSDVSDAAMGICLNGRSVKRFLFTLLTELADILFSQKAVRLLVEQVLAFFFE